VLITLEDWAARNGTAPLPPDPAPRKLKIQPHAAPAVVNEDDDVDDADDDSYDADDAFAEDDDDDGFPDDDDDDGGRG
jgi:hypothetical protein